MYRFPAFLRHRTTAAASFDRRRHAEKSVLSARQGQQITKDSCALTSGQFGLGRSGQSVGRGTNLLP